MPNKMAALLLLFPVCFQCLKDTFSFPPLSVVQAERLRTGGHYRFLTTHNLIRQG